MLRALNMPAQDLFVMLVAVSILAWPQHTLGQGPSSSDASPSSNADFKSRILQDVGFLKGNVFNFWQLHGLDSESGGFHGTLDRAGKPISPTTKSLVQQARHVWAFSTYHLQGYRPSSGLTPQQMAQSAYNFTVTFMRDPSDKLWYRAVTREGQVADSRKETYNHWFILYGFSQYHSAFGDAAAKDLALSTFKALDARLHDGVNGGYGGGALNDLMHGTEALAALHRVTGDATVLSRLLDLVEVLSTRLATSNGLIFENYTPAAGKAQWTAATSLVNYGHNLEVTWLVADTLDYLQSIGALDSSTASTYRNNIMNIGAAAVRDGFDKQYGGVYESGSPAGPGSRVKVWWVQAESMSALWKLHSFFGSSAAANSTGSANAPGSANDNSRQATNYLRLLADTARFVRQYQTDNTVAGEQFWQVEADGTFRLTGDIDKDTKGNRWKASYHSSRAPIFLEKWVK